MARIQARRRSAALKRPSRSGPRARVEAYIRYGCTFSARASASAAQSGGGIAGLESRGGADLAVRKWQSKQRRSKKYSCLFAPRRLRSRNMGDHMVEQADLGPADVATAGSRPRTNGSSSAFTTGERIAVPANAVELIRDGIRAGNDARLVTEKLREAAAIICAEAHRTDAMPEQLLISVKELCHSLTEYEHIRGASERDAFLDAVVRVAIQEYYRADTT